MPVILISMIPNFFNKRENSSQKDYRSLFRARCHEQLNTVMQNRLDFSISLDVQGVTMLADYTVKGIKGKKAYYYNLIKCLA